MFALETHVSPTRTLVPNQFYGPLSGDLFGLDELGWRIKNTRMPDTGLAAPSRVGVFAGGVLGSLLAGGLTALVFAWAFHTRDPNRPKWTPALIIGGATAVGGLIRTTAVATATS